MDTRTGGEEVLSIALGLRATAALTVRAPLTQQGRDHPIPMSMGEAPRTLNMVARPTPTPMVEPRRVPMERARFIPLLTARLPTRTMHRPPSMRTIRQPLWPTTEQGATTAVLGRPQALPPWALLQEWPLVRLWLHQRIPQTLSKPMLRATMQARTTPTQPIATQLPPMPTQRLLTRIMPR